MGEERKTERPVVPSGGVSRSPAQYNAPVLDLEEPGERTVKARREDARKRLAYILVGIYVFQLVFLAVTVLLPGDFWARAQEFAQITFGATLGLVGTVVGFYFGSER